MTLLTILLICARIPWWWTAFLLTAGAYAIWFAVKRVDW